MFADGVLPFMFTVWEVFFCSATCFDFKFAFSAVSHILDLFLLRNLHCVSNSFVVFLMISNYAGIPSKASKTILPSTWVPMHSMFVDTMLMQARLPGDKLSCLFDLVTSFSSKRTAHLKVWQSLLGHLSFACRVIGTGRPFLRCMFYLMKVHFSPNHFIHIPEHIKSDCLAWTSSLKNYNGASILAVLNPSDTLRLQYLDASHWGCVPMFGHRWFEISWPSHWKSKHINICELVPIFLALTTWGTHFRHSCSTFRSNNKAVVDVLNAGTAKDPDMLMVLRKVTLLTLHLCVNICALLYPGRSNIIADHLSCK